MSKAKRKSMIGGAAIPPPIEPMEIDEEDMNISDDEDGGTRVGDIYIPPPVKPYCSTESHGPRLIITHISNNNFKSYAGDVSLGPFFHRFHAIIGPNGSGKSNVIDSMLFVFGYRANKIRCKKLSVLLHNSSKLQNICSCRVAVHFVLIIDKADGTYEKVPNSEFFISRTAFKDNSSFYTIDDKKVHFKEVAKLLKSHNVDLDHNRFLILQGEVESIAMMKSKAQAPGECGLLEYLEDIIGTSRYKEPLEKINLRVDTLTEERTEKHNRCKMAEREMDDLKQPMEEAVGYLKLENELTRTRNLQIQKYVSEQNKTLAEIQMQQEEQTAVLNEHDEKYGTIKKNRIEKEATIKEEIANFERLERKKDEMDQMFKNALAKFSEIQMTMDTTNKRRKLIKSQLQKEEDSLVELKLVPEKNASEIVECEQKIEKLTAECTKLEETLQVNLEKLKDEIQPFIDKKSKLESELINLQRDVDETKAALTMSESELNLCQSNETTERRKYSTLKNSFEESQQSLVEKQEKVRELEASIITFRKELIEKQQQLKVNEAKEKEASAKLQRIKADISDKSTTIQAMRSNNQVLDALMKQKMDGNIPGILGRLGDLGGIDKKYDVAISTSCGRLDNIVVDKVNTAQQCIEYLRQKNIGRATFIALEKVAHFANKAAQRFQAPENVPRLYDLIQVEDPRVSAAFYFSLQDTLVADELNQGSRIAYGAVKYRVVTLRGELIEKSGTMSGGGQRQASGRMGQTVKTKTSNSSASNAISAAELETLQSKAQQLQEQIGYINQCHTELEMDIGSLNQKISYSENEVKRHKININSLTQQLPHIEEQLNAQKIIMEQTISDQARVAELNDIITTRRVEYEKSQAAAKKITDKVADIQKKIDEISGEKVKSFQTKIDNNRKQIAKLSKHVMKLNVEVSSSERNVKKTEDKIESIKSEIETAQNSLVKLKEERAQADTDAAELEKRVLAAKGEIEKVQGDSSGMKKEIVELQKAENEGKLKRLELEQALQVLDKKIADVQLQLPRWQSQLKPLKLHIIPNEEEPVDPLKTYTEDELNTYMSQDLQYKISVQEEKLKSLKPNLSAIAEYFLKRQVYLERVQVLEDTTNKRNEMRQLYDDVRKKRNTEFLQGFNIITKKLKEMYQMITQGGDAELELVDSMDPFSEGVSFSVRPPKKSWKNISNLSGGEKTLSSLALVFALHYYKPSPLYFMDEIDAALDFRNVSIVANYIKARTKNAQFIIISLRTNMFELADQLTGIFKIDDCTGSLTIENIEPSTTVVRTQTLSATATQSQPNPTANQLFDDLFSQSANNNQPSMISSQLTINDNIPPQQHVNIIRKEFADRSAAAVNLGRQNTDDDSVIDQSIEPMDEEDVSIVPNNESIVESIVEN